MTRTNQLKNAQRKLEELEKDLRELKNKRNEVFSMIKILEEKIANVKQEIETLCRAEIIVSEHAIVRYFERVLGYNVEDVCRQICTDELKKLVDQLGNGTFPVNGSKGKFKVVVKNRVVTTIEVNQ